MEQYNVTGMSCAACSARVEKAVCAVPGVESCSVSLLTNSMGVTGAAAPEQIIAAVEKAGYGAGLKQKGGAAPQPAADPLKDTETPKLLRRLISSVVFLLILMYFSMGHTMWNWPLPSALEGNHMAMGLLQMLLTIIIMIINGRFFVSGFKSLWHRAPNMDTLVALGAAASFGYSTYALFAMTGAQVAGDADGVMHYMHEFYFESAAMILTLITVGKTLEARSKGKTTDALKRLMQLTPKTAVLLENGKERTVPIEQHDCFMRGLRQIEAAGIRAQYVHCCNSAAVTWFEEAFHNSVRVGGILYGHLVMEDGVEPVDIQEIITLRAYITNLHTMPAGESIGYPQKFRSGTDLQLATLSVGFADGIPVDYARGQGPILVHGRRTRFLELCMDQSIIDVTGIPCKVGDEVTLIGQDGDERISVYSIEKRTGRTFDALLTFISDRIARICR